MPLHLLGKKSWNVYNQDNIERVRRDEAAAAAKEAAEDERMQEEDARRRIQLLRGEAVEDVRNDEADVAATPLDENPAAAFRTSERKRRRLRGEDDTDRDIRYAREDRELAQAPKRSRGSDAPIVDTRGHIALFAPPKDRSPKNKEAEAEAAKRKKDVEDQYTMRFANAAGFKTVAGAAPWYSRGITEEKAVAPDQVSRDVWGNEDPRRQAREQMRTAATDPLLDIQKGVASVRKADKARRDWKHQREREVQELIHDARRAARRERVDNRDSRRDHRSRKERPDGRDRAPRQSSPPSDASLDGFRLDDERASADRRGNSPRHRHRQRGARRDDGHHHGSSRRERH